MDFRVLQKLLNPDKTGEAYPKEPSSTDDAQNIIDAKQKMRTGMAPAGNPEQDKPLEQPWYSPDELIAGAAAPGALRVGRSMIKAAPEMLGNEAGILGSQGARSRVAKLIGAQEGEGLNESVRRLLSQDPVGITSSGHGIIDSSGKNAGEAIKGLTQRANDLGIDVIETNTPAFKSLKASLPENTGGVYYPDKKVIGINSDYVQQDPFRRAGIIGHELEHGVDQIERLQNLQKYLNYPDFDKAKLQHLQELYKSQGLTAPKSILDATKNNAWDTGLHNVMDMADANKTEEARRLSDILKSQHFAKYKNFELENALKPLIEGSSVITPEEEQIINNYPKLMRLLKK